MLDSGNGIFLMLYTAIVAIAGALAKEINDKAKTKENFTIFVSEVILHGFSGWICGLLAMKYFNVIDLISTTIYAGIGGLVGYDLVKVVFKMVVEKVSNIKINDKE